jgi:succinyl-CoA synthetase beta subunit
VSGGAGGVQIGISDESALQRGWKVLNANVRTANADLVLDGILVETMVPTDVEFMIGAKRDPQWGVVLMVGLGGVWVEVMGDVQLLPPGLSSSEIRRRIMLLRSSALLREFRGKPARDVDVLIDVIQRVDALMAAYPEIAEIDINPIVLNSKNLGAVALDALIMIGEK